jgi:glutamate 5-kinase
MRRIVIKIGSALLADPDTGKIKWTWLEALGEDLAGFSARGQEILIVSSGAIALGRSTLGLNHGPLKLEESQAAAALGQIALAHAYQDILSKHKLNAAQILLTLDDTEQRRRYLNARNTLSTLLKLGTIPVINENDTIATNEIRYGDNDRLAARVASMISADCLVLLSDVDGFYTSAPGKDKSATLIPEIAAITPEIEAMAGESESAVGSGGMVTKLEAARIATQAGTHMVITDGKLDHPLSRLEQGARCTWFLAKASPAAARKRWIAGTLKSHGTLKVDMGAMAALKSGKSLLPAGVIDITGEFHRGDAVTILSTDNVEIARGISAYDHQDARHIIGHKSGEIETILGYRGRNEIVHCDDLYLTKG